MIPHDSPGFLVLLRILRCAILLFFSVVAAGAADAARFEHDGNPIEASPTASAATASGHLQSARQSIAPERTSSSNARVRLNTNVLASEGNFQLGEELTA
jgi:hypothetical protein